MSNITTAKLKVYSYQDINYDLMDEEDNYVTESVEKKKDHTEAHLWTKGDFDFDDIIRDWRVGAGFNSLITISYFIEGAGQHGFICSHKGNKVEKHVTMDDLNKLWDEEKATLQLIPEFNKLDKDDQDDIINSVSLRRSEFNLKQFEKIVMVGKGLWCGSQIS